LHDRCPDVEASLMGQDIYGVRLSKDGPDVGSICCLVGHKQNNDYLGILTAGHIFNDHKGIRRLPYGIPIFHNGESYGHFHEHKYDNLVDLALIQLDKNYPYFSDLEKSLRPFPNIRPATHSDFEIGDEVIVVSKISSKRSAYVLEKNYTYQTSEVHKLQTIKVGSTSDEQTSKVVSDDGDSGGCVYLKKNTGEFYFVGMIVGDNRLRFTCVLPATTIIDFLQNNSYFVRL